MPSALRRLLNTLRLRLPNSGRIKPTVNTVLIYSSRLSTTTQKLKPPSTKSTDGLMNTILSVVTNVFPVMSDARETTQENVLLNVTAAPRVFLFSKAEGAALVETVRLLRLSFYFWLLHWQLEESGDSLGVHTLLSKLILQIY